MEDCWELSEGRSRKISRLSWISKSKSLFLIYINDLPFSLNKGRVTMYADDTSISYSSSSLADINQTLNSEL